MSKGIYGLTSRNLKVILYRLFYCVADPLMQSPLTEMFASLLLFVCPPVPTDGPTDGPTDQRTDISSYRDAIAASKETAEANLVISVVFLVALGL